jgi:hypothetical protein
MGVSVKVGSAEWIRNTVHRLLTDDAVLRKLKVISALRDERRCSFDFSRELTTWACRAVSPNQGRPAFLDDYWARGTGKTWKSLKEFPRRLMDLADEIERVNTADPLFYARRRGKDLERFALLRLGQSCKGLPIMIRDYSEALRERNATVTAATPRSGSQNALFQITEVVKWSTGKPHDKEVSELLNVVAEALGEDKRFDATSIAQARSRSRKKVDKT